MSNDRADVPPDPVGAFTDLAAEIDAFQAEAEKAIGDAVDEHGDARLPVPSSSSSPEQLSRDLAVSRGHLERTRQELAARQAELAARLNEQMQALQARIRADLEPLERQLELAKEGIHLISLYLGENEEVIVLADGDPAPAATPVTIRQQVLYMDEECAVAAEDGGIEPVDVAIFDDWLTADPAHLAQVLPEPRGIVALTARRHSKSYDNPWQARTMAEANRVTYWLVRNGEKVYRMVTDLFVGARLVAASDEFTRFFDVDRFGRRIEPGSRDWLDAERKADARQRHFMKVASVIEGLLHRTPFLHPLPAADMSVLTPDSYDNGHVIVITDAERTLGDGRPSFAEWRAELNKRLRPGMRIVGSFHGSWWRGMYDNAYGHERIHPPRAQNPPAAEILLIEDRDPRTADLVIRYDRTEEVWSDRDWEYRTPKTRASARIRPDDPCVLAVDGVNPDDIRYYLADRTNRAAYTSMFPLLTAVLRAREDERAAEEPFRRLLAARIARTHGIDIADAAAGLPDLIDRWKLANTYARPLVGDPAGEAKALRMIVADYIPHTTDRDRRTAEADFEQATVTTVRTDHPDVLYIGRKRNGRWVVYLPADDGVHVHRLDGSPKANRWTRTDWLLPGHHHRKWAALHTTDRWEEWPHGETAARNLTGPEITDTIGRIKEIIDRDFGVPILAIGYRPRRDSGYRPGFHVHLDDPTETEPNPAVRHGRYGLSTPEQWFPWSRTNGQVVLDGPYGQQATSWDSPHSRDPHRDDPLWPFRPPAGGGRIVWSDTDRIAALRARQDRLAAMGRSRAALWGRANRLADTVAAERAATIEADAKAAFVREYADVDLWPAHAKTLNLTPDNGERHWVRLLIGSHLARGLDTVGRTIAELHSHAAANAWPLPETDGRTFEWGAKTWADATDIPDGWADLTIPADDTQEDDTR